MSTEVEHNTEKAGWEFTMLVSGKIRPDGILSSSYPDATKLWTEKDGEDQTTFDQMLNLGKQGWRLVSVVAISGIEGITNQLLFSFERPLLPKLEETATSSAIQRAGELPKD